MSESLPDSLDRLGLKYGTDKASNHHNFLQFYERFLGHLRQLPITLLEIGVYQGGSIRTWEEYFPNARIIGMDIDPNTRRFATQRITIEMADQSNIQDLVRVGVQHGPFDLIVDDGSHIWDHQILTLQYLYPFLRPGGYYILEDIDTSYGTYYTEQYHGLSNITAARYLQLLCDQMVAGEQFDIAKEPDPFIRAFARRTEFVTFYRRTSLLRRQPG